MTRSEASNRAIKALKIFFVHTALNGAVDLESWDEMHDEQWSAVAIAAGVSYPSKETREVVKEVAKFLGQFDSGQPRDGGFPNGN